MPVPETPQARLAVPQCPSDIFPSEAFGPEPTVKASLNSFLLDLPGLPTPVLGAPLVQGKHLVLIPWFSSVGEYSVHLRVGLIRQQFGHCLQEGTLSSLVRLCWCFAKRGGNVKYTGGFSSLLCSLCSPPSHCGIIAIVVPNHSTLCNSSTTIAAPAVMLSLRAAALQVFPKSKHNFFHLHSCYTTH